MVVRVEKCGECPLLENYDLTCNHTEIVLYSEFKSLDVSECCENDTMHKDCPLRSDCISIRIK